MRQIGGHYYQIIYPIQLRHHEKMGISTREVGGSKVWSYGKRNVMQNSNTVCHSHFLSFICIISSILAYIYTFLYNDNVKLTQHCKENFSLYFFPLPMISLHIFNNIISRAQIRIVDTTQEGEEQGYV